jgi:hypothetical protein
VDFDPVERTAAQARLFGSAEDRANALIGQSVARQSGSESPTIRIRIRDCDVAIVFLLFVAGKRYV